MSSTLYAHLLDSIYESVFNEDGFDGLVTKLNSAFNATAGGYNIQNMRTQSFEKVYLKGFEGDSLETYEEYYAKTNPWFTTENFIQPNVIITEESLDPHHGKSDYYKTTEFFNDYAIPNKFGSVIGVTLTTKGNSCLNYAMMKPSDAGKYTKREIQLFEQLAPHLLRAMEISELFSLTRSHNKFMLNSLDQLNIGLVLLNARNCVIEINQSANNILSAEDGLELKSSKIDSQHTPTTQLIDSILETNNHSQKIRINDWIYAPRISLSAPYQLLIIHNNNRQLSTFIENGVASMVVIIDPARKNHIPRELIKQHLNLTERETDIATLMLQGLPAKRIAIETNISYETVRWYIKKICAINHSSSQAEFIAKTLSELSLSALTRAE